MWHARLGLEPGDASYAYIGPDSTTTGNKEDLGLDWPREFGSSYVLDDPESDMASAEILLNALAGRYTVSAAMVFAA